MLFDKLKRGYFYYFRNMFVSSTSRWHFEATSKLTKNKIKLSSESSLEVGEGASVVNCHIELYDSALSIAKGAQLNNAHIKVEHGRMSIGEDSSIKEYHVDVLRGMVTIGNTCIFEKGYNALRPYIYVNEGSLSFQNNNAIKANFWIRFGGIATIGTYNCINELTEIRCDEHVEIGSFNLISYECNIWDTNTHTIYDLDEVKQRLLSNFSAIGGENAKPLTRPIIIGSNVWIGKRASILKGSQLFDSSIVGLGAIVSGQTVLSHQIIVAAPPRIITVSND